MSSRKDSLPQFNAFLRQLPANAVLSQQLERKQELHLTDLTLNIDSKRAAFTHPGDSEWASDLTAKILEQSCYKIFASQCSADISVITSPAQPTDSGPRSFTSVTPWNLLRLPLVYPLVYLKWAMGMFNALGELKLL